MISRTLVGLGLLTTLSGFSSRALEHPKAAAHAVAGASQSTLALPMHHPTSSNASPDVSNPCIDNNGNLVECSTLSTVSYYRHRVVSNPLVWVILWTGQVNSATQQQIGGFYDALTNSEMFDWMIEYNTDFDGSNGSSQRMGRGVYGGAYTISPTVNAGTTVSDADIESELAAQIDNAQLPPPDDNTIYMIYFPAGYTITDSSGDASCDKFCAYHSTFHHNGQDVFYSVFPDLGGAGATGPSCNGVCGQQATVFQNLCSASTHELFETVTDAEVGVYDLLHLEQSWAWDAQPNGNEIGDMCNQMTGTITSLADGTSQYIVQKLFSQGWRRCQLSSGFPTSDNGSTDYKFYINPSLVVIAPGQSVAIPVTSASTWGSPPAHTLTLLGSLTGVSAAFDKTTLAADDSTLLRIAATSSATLNTESMYTLTAQGSGYYTTHTAGLVVRIEPAPTAVTLLGVTPGETVSGTITLTGTATAASSRSLYDVAIWIDDTRVAHGASGVHYNWDTTAFANGTAHTIYVVAEDDDGGNAQTSATVTVKNAPSARITAPSAGASVSGEVDVTAVGTAPGGATLSLLALQLDGTTVATSVTSPLTYQWNSALATNGSHSFSVIADDANGLSATSAAVAITVANGPTVSINAPLDGAGVGGTVAIALSAAAAIGTTLASLILQIDGQPVANQALSPLAFRWDTSALAIGSSHLLKAIATDGDGLNATVTATVTIKQSPSVTISSPSSGATLSGIARVSANATIPPSATMTSLALLVDGASVGLLTTNPATFSWDTTGATSGTHSITAQVIDSDGVSALSEPVQVTVANDFGMTLSPATAALAIGGSAVALTLKTTATGGSETIQLTLAGLPAGVVSAFSANSVRAGDSVTLSLSAPAGTLPAAATSFTVTGVTPSEPSGHSATGTITVSQGGQGRSSGCAQFSGVELLAILGLIPLLRRRARSTSTL